MSEHNGLVKITKVTLHIEFEDGTVYDYAVPPDAALQITQGATSEK